MSQTESTAEAIVDLVPAKPKRKPRIPAAAPSTTQTDEFSTVTDAPVMPAPKARRPRRSKTDALALSVAEQAMIDQASIPVSTPTSSAESATDATTDATTEASTITVLTKPVPRATLPATEFVDDVPASISAAQSLGIDAGSTVAAIALSATATPVSLAAAPRLHPDVVTLARAIRGGRTSLLPALGEDASLSVRLVSDATAPADPYCALVLHLPGGLIELGDGVRLLAALTGIDLGHSAVDLPNTQWLHSAVIGRLGQTPLRDATSITRGCLPPDRSGNLENDAPSSMQIMQLTLRSAQHAFSIQARAHAAVWLDFITRARWLREQLPIETFLDLPLSLPVLIGTHFLPQAMLADIAAGDVLLPDTTVFDCAGNGRLHWRGLQLMVGFSAPAALTIFNLESSMEQQDDAASDDVTIRAVPPHAPHSPALADNALDGLPVQLQFEMGRCHTTLANLRTLAAGTVLPIEGGSPAAIAIVANGRQLGRGELVDVNGQLGIRIMFWAA